MCVILEICIKCSAKFWKTTWGGCSDACSRGILVIDAHSFKLVNSEPQIIISMPFMPKVNVYTTCERYLISVRTQSIWTHSTACQCPAIELHKLPCACTLTASIPRCLSDAWQLASTTLPELHWSRLMRPISWRPERGLCLRMRESTDGSNHGQLFFMPMCQITPGNRIVFYQ